MFEYLEPGANDDQEAWSLPLPSKSGATNGGTRPQTPEKVWHMLYGSLAAIDRTIKILHSFGYADPNDWSEPIPVPQGGGDATERPDQWMVIMTKIVRIE